MKVQPGDRVKFLNETGGGIVTRLGRDHTIYVEIEDGFEIPVMSKDVIKIDVSETAARLFDPGENIPDSTDHVKDKMQETGDHIPIKRSGDGASGCLYMGFQPADQKWLITGEVQIYLINDTEYDIIYHLLLKDRNAYIGYDYGNIPAYSVKMLDTADRDELEYFLEGIFQVLYHQQEMPSPLSPGEFRFKTKSMKLLQEGNYITTPFLDQRAYIIKMGNPEGKSPDKKPTAEVKNTSHKEEPLIRKYITGPGFAEVDMHIEAITSDSERLKQEHKLEFQLSFLERIIESAMESGIEKIVLIHGVGAGILKMEIHRILKEYGNLEFYDASMAKYGIGATEVVIHKNKISDQ